MEENENVRCKLSSRLKWRWGAGAIIVTVSSMSVRLSWEGGEANREDWRIKRKRERPKFSFIARLPGSWCAQKKYSLEYCIDSNVPKTALSLVTRLHPERSGPKPSSFVLYWRVTSVVFYWVEANWMSCICMDVGFIVPLWILLYVYDFFFFFWEVCMWSNILFPNNYKHLYGYVLFDPKLLFRVPLFRTLM